MTLALTILPAPLEFPRQPHAECRKKQEQNDVVEGAETWNESDHGSGGVLDAASAAVFTSSVTWPRRIVVCSPYQVSALQVGRDGFQANHLVICLMTFFASLRMVSFGIVL